MVESKAELPVTVGVGAVDSTSPKGIKLETLVNSMIKVNSGLINIHYHSNNTENMDKQQHGLFGTEFPFLRKKKSGFKQVKSHLASSILSLIHI